jgi:hypothetical protein
MASHELELASAPADARRHALWLQHAAARILTEDVRDYALRKMDPGLAPDVRAAVEKGIDDALYGLMQVIDGVSGSLVGHAERVALTVTAQHLRKTSSGDDEVLLALDLRDGDGMCMGYVGWRAGDFGRDPVVAQAPECTSRT